MSRTPPESHRIGEFGSHTFALWRIPVLCHDHRRIRVYVRTERVNKHWEYIRGCELVWRQISTTLLKCEHTEWIPPLAGIIVVLTAFHNGVVVWLDVDNMFYRCACSLQMQRLPIVNQEFCGKYTYDIFSLLTFKSTSFRMSCTRGTDVEDFQIY